MALSPDTNSSGSLFGFHAGFPSLMSFCHTHVTLKMVVLGGPSLPW